MRFPRLPDWTIYGAVIAVLVVVSLGRRENADAPPSDSPATDVEIAEAEGALLGPITPFDPTITVNNPDIPFQPAAGTAFSIAGTGRWLTARHVVEGCRRPALVVSGNRALAADVRLAERADIALLITQGGPPPLPVTAQVSLRRGQRAFHPGFPQGQPGEITTRLLGRETLHVRGRGARDEPVLAWAEAGRTDGLDGSLGGLSGAPALDRQGRAIGVTIAESPRRGRVYTTSPDTFGPAIRGEQGPEAVRGEPVTIQNYGEIAEDLRRDLRVAQVVCLSA